MASETFVPTMTLSYMMVEGKLLLHQLWVSAEGGQQYWRRVPIRGAQPKKEPLYHDKMGAPVYATRVETQVFGGDEWDDRGMLVRK